MKDSISSVSQRSNILPFPQIKHNSPGSLDWLRERGLLFPSDLARDYEAVRESRGPYAVSLPEDLI